MEITARMRELYQQLPKMTFIRVMRDEFGLSFVEAKETLIRLDYDESWTLVDYHEKVILPLLEEDEEIESL